jgi:hypothetical protein
VLLLLETQAAEAAALAAEARSRQQKDQAAVALFLISKEDQIDPQED